MYKISQGQKKVLSDFNHSIMQPLNIIQDNDIFTDIIKVYFNEMDGTFGLQIYPLCLCSAKYIQEYTDILNKKHKMIKQLNELGGQKCKSNM